MYITLIFTNSDHWFSRLVCLLTGSRWSHVAIAMHRPPATRVYDANQFLNVPEWFEGPLTHVIDSRIGRGVAPPRTLASFLEAYPDHYAIEIPAPRAYNGALWLAGQIGKPYDHAGLWGFLMPWRQWQDSNAWYCFELAARVLYYSDCPYRADLDKAGRISGRQLFNYAKEFGHAVTF